MRAHALLLGLATASPALAEDSFTSPARDPALAIDAAEAYVLDRLVTSACLDIHPRTGCERVVLLLSNTNDQSADLIVMPDHRTQGDDHPLLVLRNAAFVSRLFGAAPELQRNGAGSLVLKTGMDGYGRYPWFQTWTIAFRDGTFVPAGYTYSTYDRLSLNSFSCDINLLTGDFTHELSLVGPAEDGSEDDITARQGRADIAPISPQDGLAYQAMPEPCYAAISGLYSADP